MRMSASWSRTLPRFVERSDVLDGNVSSTARLSPDVFLIFWRTPLAVDWLKVSSSASSAAFFGFGDCAIAMSTAERAYLFAVGSRPKIHSLPCEKISGLAPPPSTIGFLFFAATALAGSVTDEE